MERSPIRVFLMLDWSMTIPFSQLDIGPRYMIERSVYELS